MGCSCLCDRRWLTCELQANWALSPLSVLRFFAAMTSYMEATQLERFLPHILTPVYRITEEDTVRDPGMGTFVCALLVYRSLTWGYSRGAQDDRDRAAGSRASQSGHDGVCERV